MKKYLLFTLAFCLSLISIESTAQSITVFAWEDTNGDGEQAGEAAIAGISTTDLLAVLDANTNGVVDGGETVYNHDGGGTGEYIFDDGGAGLPAGEYILVYNTGNADNYFITAPAQGGDVTMDSDFDQATGLVVVDLTGGGDEVDIDLGLYMAGEIGDFVWDDQNGDGVQDGPEPGIPGLTVSLLDDTGAPVTDDVTGPVGPITATTDGGGNYRFDNLIPGDYIVEFEIPTIGGFNWFATTYTPHDDGTDNGTNSDAEPNIPNNPQSHIITISSDEINDDIDAGFYGAATIGNMVFCDENGNGIDDDGAGGVDRLDVRLIDENTGATAIDAEGNVHPIITTAGGGLYEFVDVKPGDYRLEFLFTVNVPSPQFAFTQKDQGGDDETDSDVENNGGSPNFGQTDVFTVISQDTEEETRWDAGVYQLITIEGIVWLEDDANSMYDGESGPGGILVEIFDAVTTNKVGQGTTAAGAYTIDDVPPGSYFIQINTVGTSLEGATGCEGSVPVDPPNDNDDNGSDDPLAMTSVFELLSNCDATNPPVINHIDFCYFFECGEENSLASGMCSMITPDEIICDIAILGTFCNTMPQPGSGNAGPPAQLCPSGGVPNNMSWFAFVAYDGVYDVIVTPLPGSCSGSSTGDEGVQIGLYTDCTFTESVYCDPNCSLAPVTFSSGILTPGQTYYFFIDGCAGSVCSYDVEITGTLIEPSVEPTEVCIDNQGDIVCDDNLILCPDSDVIFQAQGLDLTVDYTWEISVVPGSGGVLPGDMVQMSTDENLPLTFTDEGEYIVCLTNVDNGCQFWSGDLCRTITIEAIQDELFDLQTVCALDDFDPSTLENATAPDPTNPNGDGIIGWEDAGFGFSFGSNVNMVDINGCMFDQTVEIAQHPASDRGLYNPIICTTDLPLNPPGLPEITEGSFLGTTEFMLSGILLDGITDKNGCDSIVDIEIERLTILNGEVLAGDCLPEGIVINFEGFDPNLSSPDDLWTFEWFDPAGNPLADDFQPTNLFNNIAPTATGSGDYKLTITVTKDGVSCPFDYFVTVDFESQQPPQPAIDGMQNICESAGPQIYMATGVGATVFQYNWTIPAGATILSGGGTGDNMVEIDWVGSAGGTITLETLNLCGSSSNTTEVTLVPLFAPTFTATAEVCEDGSASIVYSGDQTNVDSYTWDFEGGTIENATGGNGPGPHEISWPDGGTTKTVTLSVVHDGGCISSEETVLVTIVEPTIIAEPTCASSLGQIVFTWDVLPGTDEADYSVDVTTGQAGTLVGNTFTLDGLGTLEQVDITLTLMTGDACLTADVSTFCIAQNCTPPVVSVASPGDVVEFCLNGSDQSFDIEAIIPAGVTGTGEYSGTGITDMATGTFDPDDAGEGTHTINYSYLTDDGCTAGAQIVFIVRASPMAMFSTVDTICILDAFEITYEGTTGINTSTYTTDDAQTFTESEPTITFATPGEHTISLTVIKDGCPSLTPFTKTVFVEDELDPIVINCVTQALDNVEFGWNAVDGATEYLVTVTNPDGSVDPAFSTTSTSFAQAGLNPNDSITISVTVVSGNRCPGSSDEQECFATECPDITVTVSSIPDQCVDGTNAIIDLTATLAGDGDGTGDFVWSGDGVTGSQFDPNGLAEGPVTINVEYTENGCGGYSNSTTVNLTQTPEASFNMITDPICTGSTVTLNYTGSNLPGQTIDWSGSDADVTVTATADPSVYEASFNSVGTFNIMLDVVNGSCTTSPAMSTITVEPELVFDAIDCNPQESTIDFSWAAVDCASEYEVFVNGVSQGVQTTTSFLVEGLGSEEEVDLEVIAVSGCACGNVMNTKTCETVACVQVDLAISAMGGITDFCMASDLAPIEVLATLQNETGDGSGTWTGTGINSDGVFDPMVAGVGSHTVTYTFIEPNGCEEFIESLTFNIFANPEVEAMADPITCFDDDMTALTINSTGGNGALTVTVNGAEFDPTMEVGAGPYNILVTDEEGCIAEASVDVTVPNEPTPEIAGSLELISGETSNYSIEQSLFTGLAIDSIVWTANGDVVCNDVGCFSLSNEAPTVNTTYDVTVFYNNGCSVTTSISVEVREPDPIYTVDIPNIISPNNDGSNDEWQIFTGDPEVVVNSVQVQDRWGNLVFEIPASYKPAETTITWDGRFGTSELQPGVYVYMVNYVQDGRIRTRNGDITIIR